MSPEEIEQQKMLLNLMGSIYGEAKKIDQNLVGTSLNLRPQSENVKQLFEGALRSTQPPAPPPQPQIVHVPPPNTVNLPHVVQPAQESKPIQLVDNSDLVSTLKGIESNLGKLVELFTQYEVKVKKATNRKVSRVSGEDKRPVHSESGKGQDIVDSNIDGQHVDPLRNSKPYE